MRAEGWRPGCCCPGNRALHLLPDCVSSPQAAEWGWRAASRRGSRCEGTLRGRKGPRACLMRTLSLARTMCQALWTPARGRIGPARSPPPALVLLGSPTAPTHLRFLAPASPPQSKPNAVFSFSPEPCLSKLPCLFYIVPSVQNALHLAHPCTMKLHSFQTIFLGSVGL